MAVVSVDQGGFAAAPKEIFKFSVFSAICLYYNPKQVIKALYACFFNVI